jgi:hypothetical protein
MNPTIEQFEGVPGTQGSLYKFAFIPPSRMELLAELTLREDWGAGDYALIRYLATHLYRSVQQERWEWNDTQLIMAAGHLTTEYGVPIYLGFVENDAGIENPWVMNWVGTRPACVVRPCQPALETLGEVKGTIVLPRNPLEHISEDLESEVFASLRTVPTTAALAMFEGAAQWSIAQGLVAPQVFGDVFGVLAPLFLKSRAPNAAPDAVLPLSVSGDYLFGHTLLSPARAYAAARAAVLRQHRLQPWLRAAWDSEDD